MNTGSEFVHELSRLNSLIDELYHEIAAKRGLSDSAYSILASVNSLGDGCTQTEVYKYCGMNKQTANSSVNKLKKEGLLEFSAGGRDTKLRLTETGRKVVDEKILPVEETEQEVFDEMPQEEREEVIRLLNEYLTSFREKLERRVLL